MDTTVADYNRNQMWIKIFGLDYIDWDKNKKRNMKETYARGRGLQVNEIKSYDEINLDCCKTACPPDPVIKGKKVAPKEDFFNWCLEECKKENAMNSAAHMSINAPAPMTEANIDLNKREHLNYRLHNIYHAKDSTLEEKFGLVDSPAPKTPKEVVERVKAGLFVFSNAEKADSEEAWEYSNPWRGLRWRDPSLTEDRTGYYTARKTLQAERDKLTDSLMIKDPLEALAELRAWEAA